MTIATLVGQRRTPTLPPDHNEHIATIDAASSWLQVITGPPRDGIWFRLDTVTDDEQLEPLRHAIRPHCHGLPALGATAITGWVAYAVTWLLVCRTRLCTKPSATGAD